MEILTDDDSFGGSNDECRIFKETFLGNEFCGNVQPQSGACINTNVAMSSEQSSLISYKDVLLKDPYNACSANVLHASVHQKESVSALPHHSVDSSIQRDTFHIVEYSKYNVPSGSINSGTTTAVVEASINPAGNQNKVPNLEHNNCKEITAIKQVTSPVSQESYATKSMLAIERSNSKSSIKENQEDDELFGGVSLKDTRDQLNDQLTRLMEALGWHIEVRQRDCRTYKEKVYISAEGKRVREFPKLWRLIGRDLSVNNNPEAFANAGKRWSDLGHYCSDLCKTLSRTGTLINPSETKSNLADVWNILDPFVNLMFIDRKIGTLRKGTAVEALRSIPVNAYVKNNGDLTFEELIIAPKKNSGKKGKIKPSGSSLATNTAIIVFGANDANENENMGSEEGLNARNNRNDRNEFMAAFPRGDSRQFKDAKRGGDSNLTHLSLFEKFTGLEGSLFSSSLHDVHSEMIIEWGSQHGVAEHTKDVDDMRTDDLEDHIAVETGMLLDFSRHDMSQPSGISPEHTEVLNFPNISPSEDPSMKCIMQNGSEKEPEDNVNSLHNVVVCWKEQEDLACCEKTDVDIVMVNNNQIVSVGPDSICAGTDKEWTSFAPSKKLGEELNDDDILLSAIKKKTKRRGSHTKGGSHSKSGSVSKLKVSSVKRKTKGRGRGRKLQPRIGGKAGEQLESRKCISLGGRTPLSWLIDNGVVHLDETIAYHMPQSNDVVKNGFLTKDGILCYCCCEMFSVSKYRLHAGATSPDPCSNLHMESGQTYALCQLEAWSAEYSTRKNPKNPPTYVEDTDHSDDICGLCGDGGDLICCDNCPATFHPNCLATQEIPEGNWYCSNCSCGICGELYKEEVKTRKCSQCEHKYHVACLRDNTTVPVGTYYDAWFCSQICYQLYVNIRSRVGVVEPLEKGFSFTLLRCFHEDEKSPHPPISATFKTDCNIKLAVALTIMEECFLSMLDFRTGIDMIPHMLYNFGSNFPRLDFNGFYAVILERDDVVLCVATLRIHGSASSIAEIPLVATCSKYRRQGMCRLLMGSIEEMLRALTIEKIVISAVPEQVPTWVNGFGFQQVEDEDKAMFKSLNLVVLPGTVLLNKPLLPTQTREHRLATLQQVNLPKPMMSAEPDSTEEARIVVT